MRTWYSVKHGDRYQTRYEIRLFAMDVGGDLQLLDTVEPGFEWQGIFHPSGGFLYVHDVTYGIAGPRHLIVYSIDPEGHLRAIQDLDDGGGAMAVTTPAPVPTSAGAAD
jgi:hypothetical protein